MKCVGCGGGCRSFVGWLAGVLQPRDKCLGSGCAHETSQSVPLEVNLLIPSHTYSSCGFFTDLSFIPYAAL